MKAIPFIVLNLIVMLAPPAFALCPVPDYISDGDDLIQVKGKLYDNAGNETKVSCKFTGEANAYAAFPTFSTPPSRNYQGFPFKCPALDIEVGSPFGPAGADVPIVKNGVDSKACSFVGQRNSGYGFPYGIYVSAVLKSHAGEFKSEKGALIYNLPSGSFVGTYKVTRR